MLKNKNWDPKKIVLAILIPIFIVGVGFWVNNLTTSIRNTILDEKRFETQLRMNVLATIAEDCPPGDCQLHSDILVRAINEVDKVEEVYAVAMIVTADEQKVLSERANTHISFDPFSYPEFKTMFARNQEGFIILDYISPRDGEPHTINLFYRVVPELSNANSKFVIMVGICYHSIQNDVPSMVSSGLWIFLFIIIVLYLLLAVLVVSNGYAWLEKKVGTD